MSCITKEEEKEKGKPDTTSVRKSSKCLVILLQNIDKMDLILDDCSSVYPENTKPHPPHKNHPPENTREQLRKTNYQLPGVSPLSSSISGITKYISISQWRMEIFLTEKQIVECGSHGWYEIICHCIKMLLPKEALNRLL